MGSATPSRVPSSWEGRRTPMGASIADSRTPAWGAVGRIPRSYQDQRPDSFGGRTPAYGNEGGRTVNPYFEGGGRTVNPYADGSRTAYGGNKTPAYVLNSAFAPTL
jgi:transcription elongation factor SPT5